MEISYLRSLELHAVKLTLHLNYMKVGKLTTGHPSSVNNYRIWRYSMCEIHGYARLSLLTMSTEETKIQNNSNNKTAIVN